MGSDKKGGKNVHMDSFCGPPSYHAVFTRPCHCIKMPDGQLKRQDKGIPMGDAISPGETVIACAWMENEYMQGLQEEDKKHFSAGRYMDDVILVCKHERTWDYKGFQAALTNQCYISPLHLEPSKEGVFLETEFEVLQNKINHRLKNDNKDAFHPKIWRYQHFNSYAPFIRKRAVIMAALNKVQFHASSRYQCTLSGILKVREFMAAGYPDSVIKYCTNIMATHHDFWAWKNVYNKYRDFYGSNVDLKSFSTTTCN